MKDSAHTVSSCTDNPLPESEPLAPEIQRDDTTETVTPTAAIQPIHRSLTLKSTEIPMDIDQMTIDNACEQFQLNREQRRAFRIIVKHSEETDNTPLRIYVGGAGRTGKSRLIHAI